MASTSKSPTPTSESKFPISSPSLTQSDPPPSSLPESFPYDVFLSFRGMDTRNNFISHLYDRLTTAGIRTFMDDPQLRSGREISQQLMRAIEESRIYIVVFSQNYASSRWCLDELVKIMYQYLEKSGRVVLPVFHGVQPSDVRGQKGSYEEAFRTHEAYYVGQPELLKMWRNALFRAANLSGFNLQSSALGSESRLVSLIIKEVLSLVNPKTMFIAKYPVGLDSRVNEVCSLLALESDHHVQFIGIFGMGGSGKTVIAKALYNKILHYFDSRCFLANVRETSRQPNGLVNLQEKLLSMLLMGEKFRINSVDEGIEIIWERLRLKKVLIVLDDTDNLCQVDALAGHHDWFGPGSLIIITTRDQHLLIQVEVDERCEPKELNSEESLELFSWHAFKIGFPQEHYAAIAFKIVEYSRGLPLALVVLGSYLCGRPVQQWISAFESLQKIPDRDIQKILKISYDGLDNEEQEEIFLDIACFFIGMDMDYVTEILDGCDFSTEICIGILKDRCLLTIDKNNEMRMHDLIRNMGREIIRQQCPLEPGKRSRLWSHQDTAKVFMGNKGTEAIKGVLLVSGTDEEIHLNTENFARMYNLRLLEMYNVHLGGGFENLSKEIRWIRWEGFSLEHLPSDLELQNLVVLDMQHSKMSAVWQDFKLLVHLKILNLSHSKCLTSTPDFKSVPSLLTLILEGCTSLVHIDPSIGFLNSLLVLNLKGCEKIINIPSQVCRLRLLTYLNLSGCPIKELPHNIGNSRSLRELYADETEITQLPSSFNGLNNLTSLSLRGCTRMSGKANKPLILLGFMQMSLSAESRSLRRLNLRECNLSDDDIPDTIGNLSGLQEIDLAGNSLSKLPDSFRELTNLQSLSLDNWSILQSMSGLPPNLEALVDENTTAYTAIGDLTDHQIQGMITQNLEVTLTESVESIINEEEEEEAEISFYQIQDVITPNVELSVKERGELSVKERGESLVAKKEKAKSTSSCMCL